MKLLLIRHGQTNENKDDIVQGQSCGILNHTGIKQAELLAEYLKDLPIDAIYCSDMQRTKDTLKPILNYHKCPVNYVAELREKSFGIFEMQNSQTYYQAVSESGLSKITYCPPNGESFIQMQERVSKFWHALKNTYKTAPENDNPKILCCAHGGTIRCFLALLKIMTLEKALLTTINNTSITTIEFNTNYEILCYDISNASHLPKHYIT